MNRNINELNNKLDNELNNKLDNELNNKLDNSIERRVDTFVVNLPAYAASRKPKYYKIGKHAKVEKMTSDDYANIDKFPKGTIFYYQYPEEGIKLDI